MCINANDSVKMNFQHIFSRRFLFATSKRIKLCIKDDKNRKSPVYFKLQIRVFVTNIVCIIGYVMITIKCFLFHIINQIRIQKTSF